MEYDYFFEVELIDLANISTLLPDEWHDIVSFPASFPRLENNFIFATKEEDIPSLEPSPNHPYIDSLSPKTLRRLFGSTTVSLAKIYSSDATVKDKQDKTTIGKWASSADVLYGSDGPNSPSSNFMKSLVSKTRSSSLRTMIPLPCSRSLTKLNSSLSASGASNK